MRTKAQLEFLTCVAALALGTPAAAVQSEAPGAPAGSLVPKLEVVEGFQGLDVERCAQLYGQPLLVYCPERIRAGSKAWETELDTVAAMNALQEKYRARGLVVLALISEPEEQAIELAGTYGIQHPFGWYEGQIQEWIWTDVEQFFGSAALRAEGVLVGPWLNLIGPASEPALEASFVGAFELPTWEWPKKAEKLRDLVVKRRIGEALARAERAEDLPAEILRGLQASIDQQLALMNAARDAGDYLSAVEQAQRLDDELAQSTYAGTPGALISEVRLDRAKLGQLELQEDVSELRDELRKTGWTLKSVGKLEKKARRLRKDWPESFAGKSALALQQELADFLARQCEGGCGKHPEECAC